MSEFSVRNLLVYTYTVTFLTSTCRKLFVIMQFNPFRWCDQQSLTRSHTQHTSVRRTRL